MLTEAHRKMRIGKITSSRSPAILGLSPYASTEDVMREMVREFHGLEPEFQGNVATDHGNQYESEAIAAFELEMDASVNEVRFTLHQGFDWIGDSADGWAIPEFHHSAPLEVKCPYSGKIQTIADRPDYAVQCQHHAFVHGAHGCWYACYVPGSPLHTEWVLAAFPYLQTLSQFHERYLEIVASAELSKPHLEALEVDMSDNQEWTILERRYMEAKDESEQLQIVLNEYKAQLVGLAQCQEKPCFGTRYRVSPVAGRKSVNYKAALKDAGIEDLSEYTSVGEAGWRITEVKK